MQFTTRSKLSIFFLLALTITLVAGFAMYGASGRSAAHAAATTATYSTSTGSVKLVGTVNPMSLPAATNPVQTSRINLLKSITRSRPNSASAHSLARTTSQIKASSSSLAAGTLLHNFDGVSEVQNLAASNTPLEPPDEAIAVGNGVVLNLVNVTGAFYRPNGTLYFPPFYANSLFLEPSTAFLSDPRAFFDASTNTWFALIWEADFTGGTESHIDLAVNSSGNPFTSWTVYRFDTTDVNGYQCPCFPDYTILGMDQYNVYMSGNEFSILGSAFNGAEIYAVSKSQLEKGLTANFVRFGSLSVAGTAAYHVQPATSYGSPNAEYFMSSLDPNSTFDNRLAVWAMTNRRSVTGGVGTPYLSAVIINSEAYGFPVNALTPPGYNSFELSPTTGVIASDFDAMQEVEYINGHLVAALNTSITIPGDTFTRDGVAWFQVSPSLSGRIIGGATITQQGYLAMQGQYLMYPHINQTWNGNDVMTFSIGGPNTFLSAAYSVKTAGASNFGPIHVAGAGVAPDNGFTATPGFGGVGRWGDYSAGQLDPSSNNIWLATQYIPNNGDQFANWGNRVFEVQA